MTLRHRDGVAGSSVRAVSNFGVGMQDSSNLGYRRMSDRPLISVIVVNWNGLRLLDECFGSLAKQTWPNKEFILVDNGSTDGSRDLLTAWARRLPNAQSILLPTNTGF